MTKTRNEQPRTINCPALRTLHALERTLRNHIHDLMQVECEDPDAAEAIVFAIESAERALQQTGVVRRRLREC